MNYNSEFQYNCLCRFELIAQPYTDNANYFNTTVCVGSRVFFVNNWFFLIRFQYNCLCRFEKLGLEYSYIRVSFQYNCLCRFEISAASEKANIKTISIQLFVSVRD